MLRPPTPYKVNMSPYVIPGLKIGRASRMQNGIIDATCEYFEVTFKELCSRKRTRHLCEPRQIIMYLLYTYTSLSLREIGEVFGSYDHATVINSRERVKDRMQTIPEMNRAIARIKIKAEIEDTPTILEPIANS